MSLGLGKELISERSQAKKDHQGRCNELAEASCAQAVCACIHLINPETVNGLPEACPHTQYCLQTRQNECVSQPDPCLQSFACQRETTWMPTQVHVKGKSQKASWHRDIGTILMLFSCCHMELSAP